MEHHWSFYLEAINIDKLWVTLKGIHILQVEKFSLQPGDVCYLGGHSGSGKSIFFKSLIRLLPIEVQNYKIFNENAMELKPELLRTKIMYLNQQPQIPHHNVHEFINFISTLSIYQGQFNQFKDNMLQLLRAFSRDEKFLTLETSNLSGGETQILQLILGILLCKNVLLLDEAFSAMDRHTQDIAEKLVLKWLNDNSSQRSIIFSSHQPELSHLNPQANYVIHKGHVQKLE